ncbi:MAG: glycosyltransferase family 2 protein [Sphingomicrobium sp.]
MTLQTADISVVIPSFDRKRLALETVQSVLAQSVAVREIIVVANGSEDHAAFWNAHSSDRVRVVRIAPIGKQAARNAGIRAARGAWVATLDDDDLYLPEFIASVVPAIEDGRADLISTDHRKFSPERDDRLTNFETAPARYWSGIRPADPSVPWSLVGKFPLPLLLKRVPAYPSTSVIRRDFALAIGGYNPAMNGILSEDLEFLIRALSQGQLALVWQPLVRYRKHAGNDTSSKLGRAIGRWRIFEFARECHSILPDDFRAALDRDLPARRRKIFRIAYDTGDQALMDEVWDKLRRSHRTPAVWLRRLSAKFRALESGKTMLRARPDRLQPEVECA